MALERLSIVRLVCLLEKISTKNTTLASRPLDPCIVIILTASDGGIVIASMVEDSFSRSCLILSAITIASPPNSELNEETNSMNCSTSCNEDSSE